MIEQVFFSQQVKQGKIIANKLVYTNCLTSFRTTKENLKTS